MVGPGSRMLFCWLLQIQCIWNQVWSLWIVQLERGTRAFPVETFPADLYQNLNNALSSPKSQCFRKMPNPDLKPIHSCYSASGLKNFITLPSSSPSLWKGFTRKILTEILGEIDKRSEGRNLCTFEMFWTSWTENAEKSWEAGGSERWEGTQGTKTQCGIFPHHRKEDFWGHSWSLWNPFSWHQMHAFHPLRDVCSRNESLRLMLYIDGVFVHPMRVSNWSWKCLYHL